MSREHRTTQSLRNGDGNFHPAGPENEGDMEIDDNPAVGEADAEVDLDDTKVDWPCPPESFQAERRFGDCPH
jgi:hypothetical protein